MALQLSLHFPKLQPARGSRKTYFHQEIKPTPIFNQPIIKHSRIRTTQFTTKATASESETPQSDTNNVSEPQIAPPSEPLSEPTNSATTELSDLGSEIKKAMKEREARDGGGGGDFWGGVAEEIRQIEWPAFGKVLGTTGVVLGVIAGSSVVLLTVNAVLAELSDQVFAGKGVQDFFG